MCSFCQIVPSCYVEFPSVHSLGYYRIKSPLFIAFPSPSLWSFFQSPIFACMAVLKSQTVLILFCMKYKIWQYRLTAALLRLNWNIDLFKLSFDICNNTHSIHCMGTVTLARFLQHGLKVSLLQKQKKHASMHSFAHRPCTRAHLVLSVQPCPDAYYQHSLPRSLHSLARLYSPQSQTSPTHFTLLSCLCPHQSISIASKRAWTRSTQT